MKALNNQGRIIGNSTTAPTKVDCSGGTGVCTNIGKFEAESGAQLEITCAVSPCTLDDMGGTILANGGT